jgi:hypothetical protein
MDLIYSFLLIITLNTCIYNLHENMKRARRTPTVLTMPSSMSAIRMQMSCHHTHLDSIVICYWIYYSSFKYMIVILLLYYIVLYLL